MVRRSLENLAVVAERFLMCASSFFDAMYQRLF